jgi:hypothetical protein
LLPTLLLTLLLSRLIVGEDRVEDEVLGRGIVESLFDVCSGAGVRLLSRVVGDTVLLGLDSRSSGTSVALGEGGLEGDGGES